MALDFEYRVDKFRLDIHRHALKILRHASNGPDEGPQAPGVRRVAQADAQAKKQVPCMGRAQHVADEFVDALAECRLHYQCEKLAGVTLAPWRFRLLFPRRCGPSRDLGRLRNAKLEPDQPEEPAEPDHAPGSIDPVNRKCDRQRHRKQCNEKRQQQSKG
jgi:hypothetical protein